MLSAKQEFLSTEEVTLVRHWLNDKGAKIFKKLVNAQIHENQIKATTKFCDERESHREDGKALMAESEHHRHTLEVMKHFADLNTKLYTVKIIEEL